MAIKSLSIRIDEELLHKLHIVADYEGLFGLAAGADSQCHNACQKQRSDLSDFHNKFPSFNCLYSLHISVQSLYYDSTFKRFCQPFNTKNLWDIPRVFL